MVHKAILNLRFPGGAHPNEIWGYAAEVRREVRNYVAPDVGGCWVAVEEEGRRLVLLLVVVGGGAWGCGVDVCHG